MIAVDSSALVAIVLGEPEGEQMLRLLTTTPATVCAANLLEAAMVVEGRAGPDGARDLDRLVEVAQLEIVAADTETYRLARAAWRRFGKGRHPARLNFGDCLAYATAKGLAVSLLYKGDDFTQTDIASALV